MKSGWFVRHDFAGLKKVFQVYRLNDAAEPDTETNREVYSTLPSRDEAVGLAKDLNKSEAERFWKR